MLKWGEYMAKKILLVDDSALMRSVICDIINSDQRFQVVQRAADGLEALDYLSRNSYDAVVLDVNMPKMNGIELLRELRKRKIPARVLMASTDTKAGAQVTLEALELGALDFVHKPSSALACKESSFREELLKALGVVVESRLQEVAPVVKGSDLLHTQKVVELVSKKSTQMTGSKIVAIASSTGGPRALQSVIPLFPTNLNAPVVIVQHMPPNFTLAMAERLNALSQIKVKEGDEGEVLQKGVVYVGKGGLHLRIKKKPNGDHYIQYEDGPSRLGVKNCANYMYESLVDCDYEQVVCSVLTGMGMDGTEGIQTLKKNKKVVTIAQNQETCVVYGMPKSVVGAGLADSVLPLEQIADEIILQVGVKNL